MKKSWIVIVAVALITVLAVGGTLAWLTDTAMASNTFTVGRIDIKLTEPSWTDNSKLYPGAVIGKNPTVTVLANSEDCYVYAMVDNQMNAAVANAVSLNINASWLPIGISGTKTVYKYALEVPQNADEQLLPPVFTNVTVNPDVVKEANIESLRSAKIEVKAYAHQSKAVTESEADAAALAYFGIK